MKQSTAGMRGVTQEHPPHRRTLDRSVRRARLSLVCLGVAAVFVAQGRCLAQDGGGSMRLTVRPHKMTMPTKNPQAGEYPLETVSEVLVSVAPQCAGEHRCPLFVMLPGGGIPARQMMDWLGPVANKYGMLLLTITEYEPSTLDAALKETFKRFAVDPDKIAIVGRCASGAAGMQFGIQNLDVFSRIASVSGGVPIAGLDPKDKTAEFYIDRGFLEAGGNFDAADQLRKAGHNVKLVLALRGHEHQAEDYDFLGHWLKESWDKPNLADRIPGQTFDSLPTLTSDVLSQMTTFWTSFAKEPDSIRVKARRANLREVMAPVGKQQGSVWMSNMAALAAKYPSVAADLKSAAMTAEQQDAYRVALISAQATKAAGGEPGEPDPNSVEAKNVAFLDTHLAEMKRLRVAGIAHMDEVMEVNQTATITHPKLADEIGPMGIWRTP